MTDFNGRMADVSLAHQFDPSLLEAHLRARIPEFGRHMRISQIQGGVSNPTLLVTTDGRDGVNRYVVRKKPPGVLLPSAHQVDREFRVMSALGPTDVPVPNARLYCSDTSVVGTEFYVMDYLEGRVFRDARLPDLSRDERTLVYDELNSALARLHSIDPATVGLGDYGRPGNYFERQLGRWTKQYRAAETNMLPAMDALISSLPAAIPDEDSAGIAHGDYRLENVMFHPTEPRLIAILDWELSTLGHPLADVAYNCFLWHCHDASWGTLDGIDVQASGIPSEEDYIAAYCRRTGRSHINGWNFYLAFGIFRLAAIMQGVYQRSLIGNVATDRDIGHGAEELAEQALSILRRGN